MDTHRTSYKALLAATACVLGIAAGGAPPPSAIPNASNPTVIDKDDLEGRAPTPLELAPTVAAAFPHDSYAPGSAARLVFFDRASAVTMQLLRVGPESTATVGNNDMEGVAMTAAHWVGAVAPGRAVTVRLGDWPTGVYFAKLVAHDGRVGFAPFLVRPHRLGEHRVAVVLPTFTWQAYNIRDDDGDGKGDSWYAHWNVHRVRLGRPYLNRGVPFNYRRYDLPFLHWLVRNGLHVDILGDSDLDAVARGDDLARAYDLVVFPGHHEYVTTHEYDVVQRYRDMGGNLAFLSANNFFWRVIRHGSTIEKTEQWRDLGRPEATLIGVQYRGNDDGQHRGHWIARDTESVPWLFDGTGINDGDTFASGGIEIDRTFSSSPRNVHVIAEIPNLFGPGFTAQMTYYETPAGARVFAAGAFTLAGQAGNPAISKLLGNLWRHLAVDA
jgi:N,N-dimethylformamidase beta subunit-like protein